MIQPPRLAPEGDSNACRCSQTSSPPPPIDEGDGGKRIKEIEKKADEKLAVDLLKVPPQDRKEPWYEDLKGVIRRQSARGAIEPLVFFPDQLFGFFTILFKRIFNGTFGWEPGQTEAYVIGHVVGKWLSTDGFGTLDFEVTSKGELKIQDADGNWHDRILGDEGYSVKIRIEVVPKVLDVLGGYKILPEPCSWVRVQGKLMWDRDGHFEVHPGKKGDIGPSVPYDEKIHGPKVYPPDHDKKMEPRGRDRAEDARDAARDRLALVASEAAAAGRTILVFREASVSAGGKLESEPFEVGVGNTVKFKFVVVNSSGSVGLIASILGSNGPDNWSEITTDVITTIGYTDLPSLTAFSFRYVKLKLIEIASAVEVLGDAVCEISGNP